MKPLAEFGTHPGEEKKLAQVARLMRVLALAALGLCLAAAAPYGPAGLALGAALGAGVLAAAWRASSVRWLKARAGRRLRIQPQAVEIQRGRFTRFVLYEDILQVRVIRKKDDSITGILLLTAEGPFAIRGFEQMELIFGHISARKPDQAMIQIEDER